MLPYLLQITLCKQPILLVIWSSCNKPASPTTDQDILDNTLYSPADSINRATGDWEQLDYLYRGELGYPEHTEKLGYPGHTRGTRSS